MKRRDFFYPNNWNKYNSNPSRESITADLSKKQGNLTFEESLHLLKRLSFHPSVKEVNHYTGMNVDQAVDSLLGDGLDYLEENESRIPDPNDSMNWVGDPIQEPKTAGALALRNQLEGQMRNRYRQLLDWIFSLGLNEDLTQKPASEKLTYFLMTIWNIEFTYDTREYLPPNLLLKNNQTLRKYRLGNYKDITKQMTLDGAFLLYQSLQLSEKSAPNENFARELMELFTMGIGHYSEGDIQEASRLLTGWRTVGFLGQVIKNGYFNTYFNPDAHDLNSKQIMGITIPARSELENNEFKVRDEEVYKLVDILFERKPEAIAKFICDKIFRFFVYANPAKTDEDIINQMAQTMINNDFELRPVFHQILTSNFFYSEENIGVQIKSPIELNLGVDRIFGKNRDLAQHRTFMAEMEQHIYDPPNVSGWPQYRSWVSTTTYPVRATLGKTALDFLSDSELIDFVKSFNSWQDPDNLADDIYKLIQPKVAFTGDLDFVKAILIEEIDSNNWIQLINSNDSRLVQNLRTIIYSLTISPAFQLQ